LHAREKRFQGNEKETVMKVVVVPIFIGVFALAASAQEAAPIFEFAGQYQMLRVNSSRNVPAYTVNGGTGSFQINFFDQVAGVLEVGSGYNNNIGGFHLKNTWLTYLVGPRISLRNRSKKVIPALEFLAGGATVFANAVNPVTLANVSGNTTGFGMAAGGTLDIRLNHLVAIRPIQLDYLLTRVNNSHNQNDLRYGAGIVFTLGAQ
jgi:hypothetical protein